MDANFQSRIATLEERARAQGDLNAHFALKLDAIAAGVARLETMAALAGAKACPAPGKCLELAEALSRQGLELQTLRGTVADLEKAAAEARGGWKVLVLIAGAAGTCGSVLGWLVNHFMSKGASGTGQ